MHAVSTNGERSEKPNSDIRDRSTHILSTETQRASGIWSPLVKTVMFAAGKGHSTANPFLFPENGYFAAYSTMLTELYASTGCHYIVPQAGLRQRQFAVFGALLVCDVNAGPVLCLEISDATPRRTVPSPSEKDEADAQMRQRMQFILEQASLNGRTLYGISAIGPYVRAYSTTGPSRSNVLAMWNDSYIHVGTSEGYRVMHEIAAKILDSRTAEKSNSNLEIAKDGPQTIAPNSVKIGTQNDSNNHNSTTLSTPPSTARTDGITLDPSSLQNDPEAVKVREWRHQLQKAFFKANAPQREDMPALASLFDLVESYEGMTADYLMYSRLDKVMRHIIALKSARVPRDDEFKFRERAAALAKKWTEISSAKSSRPNVIAVSASAVPNAVAIHDAGVIHEPTGTADSARGVPNSDGPLANAKECATMSTEPDEDDANEMEEIEQHLDGSVDVGSEEDGVLVVSDMWRTV